MPLFAAFTSLSLSLPPFPFPIFMTSFTFPSVLVRRITTFLLSHCCLLSAKL